jgi:alkanesulfonate monooxygenase SsuD/methylene tetrahydromethanopterin reductase-like flavin-dependent oxidoreductase (luciferase family)
MSGEIWLRFDVRGGGKTVSSAALMSAALEQAAWADRHGLDAVQVTEHHGTDDGYLPSPVVLAAALAAKTQRIRIHLGALILPLHDPVHVAEDVCVLDNISNGRVDVTVGIGYVPSEFQMFAADIKRRAALAEEGIAALRGAFSGAAFQFRGRTVRVSPAPVQRGGPQILVAGAVKASALRAARLGDGIFPTIVTTELLDLYRSECARVGRPVGRIVDVTGPLTIHVSTDPDRDWARVGPHFLHEVNAYGKWAEETGTPTPFQTLRDVEALKACGLYQVMTPDQCIQFITAQHAANRCVCISPLCGGLHPDIAWESLELLGNKVLPKLTHRFKTALGF